MTTHITNTWFDGEKVVTQEIPEADFYKPSMTKEQEALKLALEALEAMHTHADVACVVTPEGAVYLQPAITAIKEALAQPVQEPTCPECKAVVLYECVACSSNNYPPAAQSEDRNFCPRCGKRRGGDVNYIHTCTPPIAAGLKAFHGFPDGPVSTPNAGGKCVTAGETAPVKEIDPNQWAFDRGLEST
jgi:hypothetical protein